MRYLVTPLLPPFFTLRTFLCWTPTLFELGISVCLENAYGVEGDVEGQLWWLAVC
jgi:hypothetical protein